MLRLALPPETRVIAGASGMSRQVTWVAVQRATPPAFQNLRGGELALLTIDGLKALDPRMTLAQIVRRLGQAPVSAIAMVGPIAAEDVDAADDVRMPLLKMPDDSNLREVEREASRLITDFEAQMERRGAQLYNLLTKKSLEGVGVQGLLELLADRTGQSVSCYAINGDLRFQSGHGQGSVALQALRPKNPGDHSLINQQIWVEPIGPVEHPSSYLALAGTSLDSWDHLALQQGAAALALELAKEQAVQATEERLRGDFLSTILTGPPTTDTDALMQRGQELGYDLKQPFVAMLFAPEHDMASGGVLSRISSSIQSELSRRGIAAPLLRRENAVLCMVPVGDNGSRPRELANALRERLIGDYPGIALALGTEASALTDWPRTLREAEQALHLGRQIFESNRILSFSDLGVYRLMVLLRDSKELWSFYSETLSKLVDYDQKQQGELLKTLEAYFDHLGNLRATSDALHVHRNTLLYRLERIQQISSLDLSDSEKYFALWLALRAYKVLKGLPANGHGIPSH
jgi:purine catabolism regulator